MCLGFNQISALNISIKSIVCKKLANFFTFDDWRKDFFLYEIFGFESISNNFSNTVCYKEINTFKKHFLSVKYRYVVFRPFVDEVLVGKIKSSSAEGVQGQLNFC